jgi:hypothetical protein
VLSDRLGEDHDLAVLRERVSRSNGQVPRSAVRSVARQIGEARRELRQRALALAERVYAEKPRDLAGRLETRWRSWRRKE